MGVDDHAGGAAREKEAEIEKAILSRSADFRKQADSLTLEGVRRALEKDLDLETYSLDEHKKFIKQCVDKVLSGTYDENMNNNALNKAEAKYDHLSKEGSEGAEPMPDSIQMSSSVDEQVVRSSNKAEKDQDGEKNRDSGGDISEDMIKEAIDKRTSYFRENSETLTLQGVRRTLEEDMKLEKKTLDAYKKFITTELDKVLLEPANGISSKKGSHQDVNRKASKGSKRAREDSETSELNDSQSDMEGSDEDTRPRKRGAEKGKNMKRQKKVTDAKKLSTPKTKVMKRDSDKSIEGKGVKSAEEDNPDSSAEEDNKKKRQPAPAPAYGKQVERLKSIIKSCGTSIPPTVYRRAKQAPENKREALLIKELESILEKEGLSKNPSEKEIKAVKKRKERAKELEGIDMSNIITSSRRRSASSFIPLPKPKIEVDSEDDEDDAEGGAEDDAEENIEGGDKDDNNDAATANGSPDEAPKDSD